MLNNFVEEHQAQSSTSAKASSHEETISKDKHTNNSIGNF